MLILMLGAALLFASCDNLFENEVPEENQNEYLAGAGETELEPEPIEISGQLIFNGAVPQELISNEENNDSSRAAIPNFTSSEVDYFAVATSGTGANAKTMNGTFGTAGSANASTFSILLIPGRIWTITCGITVKNSTDASDRLLTAVLPNVNPSEIASGTTLKFFPVPDTTDTSATGQIALSMSIDVSITSVSLVPNNEYSTGWPSSLNSATITPGSTTATINASVPVGTYEILMSFFDTDNNLLYASVQNITVCKGLTTRTWISSGGDSPINSSGVFSVTAAKIRTFTSTNFYVGDTGATNAVPASNDNSGSHKAPFLTFDKALSVVQSLAGASGADTTREYTIHICGTVDNSETTTVPEIGSSLNGNMAKLIIKGRANTTNPPVLQNPNTTGRVLNIETTVPVEITGLAITSGKAEGSTGPDGYGGGLYLCGTDTDVTLNNSVIEENIASLQGGGVYIASGAKLTMKGSSSSIKNNELTESFVNSTLPIDQKPGGAGVFIAQSATLQMDGGTISGNVTTDAGGGLFIRGDFTLNKGTITSNKRTGSSGFGSADRTSNIEMATPGHFIMNGGIITSTLENGWNGAAVNIYLSSYDPTGTATFDMNGGSITGLYLRSGAVKMSGVSPTCNAVFNMNGGSITGNHATNIVQTVNDGYGGAVYVGKYSTFNMTGGEISGNEAIKQGGGVYLDSISGSGAPVFNLGKSGFTSTVKIKNNTAGTSNATNNVYLPSGKSIAVAGILSTTSEVGVTRAGSFSSTPFTSGFADTNSGTQPSEIFKSDEGYNIIAGTGGEAAFGSTSGSVYMPADYIFTLTANKDSVTLGRSAQVTITPDVKRKESDGSEIQLYYNPANQKLYLDSTFTQSAGGTNTVTWEAALWCGLDEEQPDLAAGSGSNANKFTIAALDYPDTYTLRVRATYMGYPHDASFTVEGVASSTEVTSATPLTLEAAVAGAVVTFDNKATGPVTYKVNGGTAQTIASGTSSNITLTDIGDKVEFFGNNASYGHFSDDSSNISCTKDTYVYGNIMSLINSTGYETADTLTGNYAFAYLFHNNTKLKNKTGADLLLPATTLSEGCYRDLFSDCTSLTAAPSLPATTLAEHCYNAMFSGCTSLTAAPALPATTLERDCYISMFNGCTSLTTAPELPATTLKTYCYDNMFAGCTSLTTAPILPATTLVDYCYVTMFHGCTSLNSITCLATNISAERCLTSWLDNVASTGTFTKSSSMSGWPTGEDGIPSGWTIQNAP